MFLFWMIQNHCSRCARSTFSISLRVNCSKYIICSNVLQRVSIHPSFWCKFWVSFKSSWGWSSLLTSRIVVNFLGPQERHCGFCVWFWCSSLLSPSSVYGSGSSLLGHLVAWLSFPLPLKKPTRNCPTTYFLGRWNPSITATLSICVSIRFVVFRNTFFWPSQVSKKKMFFSVSWWGQGFLIEDHLVKWSLKCSTGRICSEFILCISWTI